VLRIKKDENVIASYEFNTSGAKRARKKTEAKES